MIKYKCKGCNTKHEYPIEIEMTQEDFNKMHQIIQTIDDESYNEDFDHTLPISYWIQSCIKKEIDKLNIDDLRAELKEKVERRRKMREENEKIEAKLAEKEKQLREEQLNKEEN